jgi:RNA polymerase sigma-70 factor, ECF subfamily
VTESGVYRALDERALGARTLTEKTRGAWVDARHRASGMMLVAMPPSEPLRPAEAAPIADGELVRRVAEGDRDALGELYDRYGALLVGVGVRILRSRRDAEDIAHDVYLEVWRRAGAYDGARASVRSWLLMMMRSRALDRRKSAGFSWGVPLEVEPAAEAFGAEPLAELAIDRGRAVRALAALPDAQREVLVLGYFDGLSSSEIAETLSVPVGTVKSRVAAALRALRESMGAPTAGEAAGYSVSSSSGERT